MKENPPARDGFAVIARRGIVHRANVDREHRGRTHREHHRDLEIHERAISEVKETYGKVIDVATVDEHVAIVAEGREETGERHGGSDVAPGVARRVDLHAGVGDVGGVAEEREPPASLLSQFAR